MTRFAIYERVQGSFVQTWRVDAESEGGAFVKAFKVGIRAPVQFKKLESATQPPATKKPKKRDGRKR